MSCISRIILNENENENETDVEKQSEGRLKGREVRPEGCICEPCSDISLNWKDIRTKFGYSMLYAIGFGTLIIRQTLSEIHSAPHACE